jgi:RNA polymerase sigma-70 factor (ECF subfamily)
MMLADEAELVRRAKLDPTAFGQLYDLYVNRIYSYAYRQTQDTALAQDITSATFENALRNLDRFQWRGISFVAWLYRIARNEMVKQYRHQRSLTPLESEKAVGRGYAVDSLADQQDARPTEVTIQWRQRDDTLHRALAQLSGNDRDLLTLRYLEELSAAEVAQIIGCSRQNAYVRLHRALQRLRQQMEQLEVGEETTNHER